MTLARLVILNPSTVTLSPSYVILNEVKNLRAGTVKSLRTSSVKDLWQTDPLQISEMARLNMRSDSFHRQVNPQRLLNFS